MDPVERIEAFTLTAPRTEPYLGILRDSDKMIGNGYFARGGNRTVYPIDQRSVIVRLTTESGVVGWGETYGLVVPRATVAIIEDLLAHCVIGRVPSDAEEIYDELYGLMRVRGYCRGYYHDALAAIDIALWDAAGKQQGAPIYEIMGGRRHDELPAYVSGLPEPTLESRVELACRWADRGFDSFKFAAPVADDGVTDEAKALRAALGKEARIACDLHWTNSADRAVEIIRGLESCGIWFAESPVEPEDIAGLAKVAETVAVPIAAGEEWSTVHDAVLRFETSGVDIVQPEMGHTGLTQFMRICREAEKHGLAVIPHATVGAGIFLSASLQASMALEVVEAHEFQHSIFERNMWMISGDLECSRGNYRMGDMAGIGVEPSDAAIEKLVN